MSTIKTTLGRLAVYIFLLALNIIPCASIIPDTFPTRNVSTIYLLFLSACLIWYYSYRIIGSGYLPLLMKSLSWMAFFLIMLRGIKYSVFAGVAVLARHTWYLYYVPMLLIPLFFFYISLIITSEADLGIPKMYYLVAVVTVVFVLLVLTNDLHRLIFQFNSGFTNWDSEYTHGFLFYIITAWQYILYFAAVIILIFKCRIGDSRKNAWITAIPFILGIFMNALIITEKMPKINGTYIIEFPESLIFMVSGVLECCMQLGLIPTNKSYGKLFEILSLSAQITDKQGRPVYLSQYASPLKEEQFYAPDGERVSEHTVLHKMELPGGFGFWQDDMTALDRLNEELEEAKEVLKQETELIRLQNELKEKQTKIEQRTVMYDTIAKRIWRQSQAISRFAGSARESSDTELRKKYRNRITLIASYVKRYANLTLLSYENSDIEIGELSLSFSEVLRYLNFSGIPGELFLTATGRVSSESALAVFEAFGALLTANISNLLGVFINISSDNNVVLKITLENLKESLSNKDFEELSNAGVNAEIISEDDVTYISFTLPGREHVI
ncbi:MAG: hypothetical protein J5659_07370 [Clostridia bacterium]|nr:hypothetical protein [Clostridia bacterium]